MHSIKTFSDRYPLLGPLIWVLSVQYFLIQWIVARAWLVTPYSWRMNTISDLGNTVCGTNGARYICSPLHVLMNVSLITLGLLMATGSGLIYNEFVRNRASLSGFCLMSIAGIGTVLVGVFPENTIPLLHIVGAGLTFVLGNLSLIILGFALFKTAPLMRLYSLMSGSIPLLALIFFVRHQYVGIGIGGMERIIAYPQTIWLIFFGLYMSGNHYLKSRHLKN